MKFESKVLFAASSVLLGALLLQFATVFEHLENDYLHTSADLFSNAITGANDPKVDSFGLLLDSNKQLGYAFNAAYLRGGSDVLATVLFITGAALGVSAARSYKSKAN